MSTPRIEKRYTSKEAVRLAQALSEGLLDVLKPTFSFEQGFHYPKAEEIMGLPSQEVKQMLETFAEDGILLRELADNILICPGCKSHKLAKKLTCPNCGASSLRKGVVIQHLTCGYIDFEENFDELICPKCRKPLKALGVDYRKPGFFYKCLSCKDFTGLPKQVHVCGECGNTFSDEEASTLLAYSYYFNEAKRATLEINALDFKPVVEKLGGLGWQVEIFGVVKGMSGVEHEFTLVISPAIDDPSAQIVVEIAVDETGVKETAVLSLFARAFDAGIKDVVLVTIPSLGQPASKLAEHYGMRVVESTHCSEAVETLLVQLQQILDVRMKAEPLANVEDAPWKTIA
jgi:hypothetical protein